MSNNRLENNNKTNGGNIDGGAPYKPTLFCVGKKSEAEARKKCQEEINIRNDIFISSLDESEQAKFKAIGEVMEILSKNNISAYIFPTLPADNKGLVGVYQYNNIHDTCGEDPNKISPFVAGFYHSLFAQIFVPLSEKIVKKPVMETIKEIYETYYLEPIKNKDHE